MIRLLRDRLVVAWCQISGSHFIEPWSWYIGDPFSDDDHAGCGACTWCDDCKRLLGREGIG